MTLHSDTERLAGQLLRDGYLILENHLAPDLLRRVYRELDPHFGAASFELRLNERDDIAGVGEQRRNDRENELE